MPANEPVADDICLVAVHVTSARAEAEVSR
jgi:hypothetical protein